MGGAPANSGPSSSTVTQATSNGTKPKHYSQVVVNTSTPNNATQGNFGAQSSKLVNGLPSSKEKTIGGQSRQHAYQGANRAYGNFASGGGETKKSGSVSSSHKNSSQGVSLGNNRGSTSPIS